MATIEPHPDEVNSHDSSPLLSRGASNASVSANFDVREEHTPNVEHYNSDIWVHSPSLSLRTSDLDRLREQQQDLPSIASPVDSVPDIYGYVKSFEPWFPAVNPEHSQAKTWRTWKARRGVVLWSCFIAASSVCLTNFSVATWAWLHFGTTPDGAVELYHGDCAIVKRADALAHVLINVLSTLILGASNLTLQLLVAPTRKEVDEAHAKGKWLDIGVPSFRNLWSISRLRAILWSVLAVTSIPIHFLYNSTVFSSISTNEISVVVATEKFLTQSDWTAGASISYPNITIYNVTMGFEEFWAINETHNDYHKNPTQYQNHSTYGCLKTYMNPFDWRPSMLILISSDTESRMVNSSVLLQWKTVRPQATSAAHFLCDQNDEMIAKCESFNSENSGNFTYRGNKIDYALYKTTDPVQPKVKTCYLQGSPQFLMVVALINLVKCLCILKVTWSGYGNTLCVLGDAIASFLETPDLTTKGLGIASRKHIVEFGKDWNLGNRRAIPWRPRPIPWRHAVSLRRWAFVISIWLNIIVGLITQHRYHRSITFKSLWAMGFGETNIDEVMSYHQANEGKLGLFANTLIANTAQVVVSLAYIAHNALLSCMMVADEWCGFAKHRKTLRVSAPVGIQRSSYFLSMPLRYGLPMMVLFSIEHWLLSQSTFIVRVNKFDWTGVPKQGWTTTGYSFIPCLMAVNLFLLTLIVQIIHGYLRKYPSEGAMPLASTCSAAISAACHRPEADKEAHLLPVQWGVVGTDDQNTEYCSFTTSRNVTMPSTGSYYLGMSSPTVEKKDRSRIPRWMSKKRLTRKLSR